MVLWLLLFILSDKIKYTMEENKQSMPVIAKEISRNLERKKDFPFITNHPPRHAKPIPTNLVAYVWYSWICFAISIKLRRSIKSLL